MQSYVEEGRKQIQYVSQKSWYSHNNRISQTRTVSVVTDFCLQMGELRMMSLTKQNVNLMLAG